MTRPVTSISTIEIQELLTKQKNNSVSQLSSERSQEISTLSWSEYFNPPLSVWGNYTSKPQKQAEFETEVRKALENSVKVDAFQPNIEI